MPNSYYYNLGESFYYKIDSDYWLIDIILLEKFLCNLIGDITDDFCLKAKGGNEECLGIKLEFYKLLYSKKICLRNSIIGRF